MSDFTEDPAWILGRDAAQMVIIRALVERAVSGETLPLDRDALVNSARESAAALAKAEGADMSNGVMKGAQYAIDALILSPLSDAKDKE